MNELADIEAAVVGLIAAIEENATPVLRTVRGLAAADRRTALAAMQRWLRPAAAVLIDGRGKSGADSAAGDITLSVFIASTGLRSDDAGRLGDTDTLGAFDLTARVGAVLEGALLGGYGRLVAHDEQVAEADERHVVIEQRWRLDSSVRGLPTFGGEAITGIDSIVSVHIGALEAAAVTFAFPGIDGAYRHELGNRGRTITWRGLLRATDDTELNAIEAAIEALIGDGRGCELQDGVGGAFESCIVKRFARNGARKRARGKVIQAFEISFAQVAG